MAGASRPPCHAGSDDADERLPAGARLDRQDFPQSRTTGSWWKTRRISAPFKPSTPTRPAIPRVPMDAEGLLIDQGGRDKSARTNRSWPIWCRPFKTLPGITMTRQRRLAFLKTRPKASSSRSWKMIPTDICGFPDRRSRPCTASPRAGESSTCRPSPRFFRRASVSDLCSRNRT